MSGWDVTSITIGDGGPGTSTVYAPESGPFSFLDPTTEIAKGAPMGNGGFFDGLSSLISGIGSVASQGIATLTGLEYQLSQPSPQELAAQQAARNQLIMYVLIGVGIYLLVRR